MIGSRKCSIYAFSDCKTVKNEKCVFPFKYKNQLYTGCISLDHQEKKLWCSTKNTEEGTYETWDDCASTCPEGQSYKAKQKNPSQHKRPITSTS